MKTKKPDQLPVLLTVKQAAKRCSVCEKTVRRWIKDRGLPVSRPPPGRIIRIAEIDLAKFIGRVRKR